MHVDPCIRCSPRCRPASLSIGGPGNIIVKPPAHRVPPSLKVPSAHLCSRSRPGEFELRQCLDPVRQSFAVMHLKYLASNLACHMSRGKQYLDRAPSLELWLDTFTAEPQRFDHPNRAQFRPQSPLITSCSIYIEPKKPASPCRNSRDLDMRNRFAKGTPPRTHSTPNHQTA